MDFLTGRRSGFLFGAHSSFSGAMLDFTLPETNTFAPENWRLELLVSFWEGPFSGAMLVSRSVEVQKTGRYFLLNYPTIAIRDPFTEDFFIYNESLQIPSGKMCVMNWSALKQPTADVFDNKLLDIFRIKTRW